MLVHPLKLVMLEFYIRINGCLFYSIRVLNLGNHERQFLIKAVQLKVQNEDHLSTEQE